jgi:hypothetical protein
MIQISSALTRRVARIGHRSQTLERIRIPERRSRNALALAVELSQIRLKSPQPLSTFTLNQARLNDPSPV